MKHTILCASLFLCLLSYSCQNEKSPKEPTVTQEETLTKDSKEVVTSSTGNNETLTQLPSPLNAWLNFYQRQIPNLEISAFKKSHENIASEFYQTPYRLQDNFKIYAKKSPDGTRYLDVMSYGTELVKEADGSTSLVGESPNHSALVIDIEKDESQRILFCGTPCDFQEGAWLGNDAVLVAGYADGENGGYYPTIWQIDLQTRLVTTYQYPRALGKENLDYIKELIN